MSKLNNTVPCPNCNGDGRVPQFPPAPEHVGLHASRMEHPCHSTTREKAFAEQWKKENEQSWSKQAVLNGLLYSRLALPHEHSMFGEVTEGHATQREATIAATVIQYLGTNCGFDFVRLALKAAGYELVPVGEREKREEEVSGIRQEIKVLRERLRKAVRYEVGELHGHPLYIESRGPRSWVCTNLSAVLSTDGLWEYEPNPSNRTDEFIARTRFATVKAALKNLERHYQSPPVADSGKE